MAANTNEQHPDKGDDEWVRSYHERLRQISVVDALDGVPACPRLPAELDDPIALENWSAAWNAWIAHEAVQQQRPLLKRMTRETLAGIVQGEKLARAHERSCSTLRVCLARSGKNAKRCDVTWHCAYAGETRTLNVL
jgi:hypothetical protein